MRSRDREKNPKGKVKEKGSIKMTKNINIKSIAAATISLAIAASLAPTAAFATDASELPPAVAMAAQATTTQASVHDSSIATFAESIHTLVDGEAAKVFMAQAQAQGLDADAALVTVYNA